MNCLINLKNNLIQNFYILGLSPEDFFFINENNEREFLNIFQQKEEINLEGKVISKFPPDNNNFNGVNDETILNHCFPNGLHLIKQDSKEIKPIPFYFELDNILINYSLDEKNIYSKIYFTCIEIFEPLNNYLIYKQVIIKDFSQKKNNIKKTNTDINEIHNDLFIPKVLCFASVLPFYHELKEILNIIYELYLSPNNSYKIEKIIEQIVLKIPIPLNHESKLQLSFDSSITKDIVFFPLYNINEENIKLFYTVNTGYIFYYFQIDDVLKILKYILLEIPIIFFSNDRNRLTSVLENLLSFISPFKYVHPFISILPKKHYGFISIEKKFIFGINENYYQNFFNKNNIEINKNIVILYTDKNEDGKIDIIYKDNFENNNDILIIEEEKNSSEKNLESNYIDNDYVIFNGTKTDLINLELPNDCRKKLHDDLNKYVGKMKGNLLKDFNYKIKKYFYDFFVYILSGYNDYYLNSKFFSDSFNTKNCGYEILFKNNSDKEINDLNFIKEIFNLDEFINKSESPIFYFVFCQTKLFIEFLRERIYLNNKNYLMKYRQFDQICFLKKHKDYRKKKENKGIYDTFRKKDPEKIKNEKITLIKISNDDFTQAEKDQIKKKNKEEILIKYGQKINVEKKNVINIKYYIFPKLLFDNEFFDTKYENLFLSHNINKDMPTSRTLDDYKKLCTLYGGEYSKQRGYIFPPLIFEKLPSTNNSKVNFSITSYYYIFYDWIILLCCSLWYCEPIERIIRLNEVIAILDKLNYIEEIVLKLCFDAFIKYGNKSQCILVYEKVTKFYGHSNYLFLNLLSNKLCQEEQTNFEEYLSNNNQGFTSDENNNNEYIFKDRSIILNIDNFVRKRMTLSPSSNNVDNNLNNNFFRNTMFTTNKFKSSVIIFNKSQQESNYKEKIIFSSEQYCKKCKCFNSFDFEEIKKQKLSKINFNYKCIKCKTHKTDILIKYQILLYNKKRNELYITKMGEFNLLPPNRLFTELMFILTSQRNWEINIDNIMSQTQINLMNYIFYFSIENLSFDFLLPFKKLDDENIELIQNNLCKVICNINKKRFSIVNMESNDINKGLTENTENDNFIPIDISNADNFDKYFDLIPCVINNEPEEEIFGENNENNDNIDNENFSEFKSTNYFTINGQNVEK